MDNQIDEKRTDQQRKAIEVWCDLISTALNDAGYTQATVFKAPLEVDFTKHTIKDLMRHLGKKMFGKSHTSQFTKSELQLVQEIIIRELGHKGITIPPFPSRD